MREICIIVGLRGEVLCGGKRGEVNVNMLPKPKVVARRCHPLKAAGTPRTTTASVPGRNDVVLIFEMALTS